MANRVGQRQFKANSNDSNALEGLVTRLNEWLAAQSEKVRIINVETLRSTGGSLPIRQDSGERQEVAAIQVWYEVEEVDQAVA